MSITLAEIIQSLDKGWATLIAASLAAVVSLVSLSISIWSSRAQARLAGCMTDWTNVSKEGREYKLKQLTCFYDPVYTLLAANKNIFERIGPISAAKRGGQFNDEETAKVWEKLSAEVIVPNNIKICEIIEKNLHFMSDADDESVYLEFVTHAHAYKVFGQDAYEAYKLFPFPKEFYSLVQRARAEVRANLASTYSLKEK
ncbi:hypothetical protein [Candidatus Nitrotoga sp. AM1P]|uniref:hypothetical protein n=1 Tax=Candidatus Nitrotoga sp. AM1P TaxID=2559597 RepID=UPI0010B85CD0|nr:hypothetical protein [Candidatus Nitrotoga sp. AM1P]BBJ22642.1 hypothetical protein W01_05690 [Candidatus Nitrotoga sp. AM1P]